MTLIVKATMTYEYEVEMDDLDFICLSDDRLIVHCANEDPVLPAKFVNDELIPYSTPDEVEFHVDYITTEDGNIVVDNTSKK